MTKIDLQFPDGTSSLTLTTEAESGPKLLHQSELTWAIALTQGGNNAQIAGVLEGLVGASLTDDVVELASGPETRPEFLTQLLMALGDGSDLATVVKGLMLEGVSSSDVQAVAEADEVAFEPIVEPKHTSRVALRPPIMRPAEGSRKATASPAPVIDGGTGGQFPVGVYRRKAKPVARPSGFLRA